MASFATVLATVRYLRPRQVRYQLLRKCSGSSRGTALPMQWKVLSSRVPLALNFRPTRWIDGKSFRFNNEVRAFPPNWRDAAARKLWLYNLHYMQWLFEMPDGQENAIHDWIEHNPSDKGGDGWEPYPTSLRIFNWCKYYFSAAKSPERGVLESLARQAGHLTANLEFHIDGNHLLENLLALAMVGFCVDQGTPKGKQWSARVESLLLSEIRDQYLEDGGHYELSPMYHALLLEKMLDLLNLWPSENAPMARARELIETTAYKACHWLRIMAVGGEFGLFNDSAYDAAPHAEKLLQYGAAVLNRTGAERQSLEALPNSGYVRAETGRLTLLFDGGNLGPDHQLGHAQGDMLSFCLWIDEKPFLVHPGNFEYVQGEMRDYCRSTAAHNTLVIDGWEQAEWWSSHRVGRRGYATSLAAEWKSDAATAEVSGSHDAYAYLPGRPRHHRRLELAPDGLRLLDRVDSKSSHTLESYLHFHPECALQEKEGGFEVAFHNCRVWLTCDAPLKSISSYYCPEFGKRFSNQALVAASNRDSIQWRLKWIAQDVA